MAVRVHILILLFLLGSASAYTQETQEDIEKKANKLFEQESFVEATSLYSRLLSLEPRNHNYNYRYGTCLLFNSKNKKSAFKYLNFAVSGSNVDDEAYYYLGRAFHLNYEFKKAITNYEKYKQKAGSRAIDRLNVERQIEMCRNGLTLLANLTETVVLGKKEIDIENFFRIYDLNNIGGEIIVTEAFQTRQDKRNDHVPIIHFPAHTNRIYYSSYGDKGDSKDIYMRQRLPDGSWSLAQEVFGEVNTEFDEDFPYMHPNGIYLYFASKGHNSMGGYDIFRSRLDRETNEFMKPENLDFAISSPDDDMLYIVDSLDQYAYFASKRESEFGKVHVYHVSVERFPTQIAVIKGQFNSTIDPNNKDIEIIVNDAKGDKVGEFKSSKKGDYLITLSRGGRYEFVMTVGGKENSYKQEIDVPFLREFKPLKQEIVETIKNEREVVLIRNKFDEEFDDPVAVMSEVIQARSKMDVNKDEYDLDSLQKIAEQRKILDEVGLKNFSNYEILQLAEDKYNAITERVERSENQKNKALQAIENAKNTKKNAINRADSLFKLAENAEDPQVASNYFKSAEQALNTAKRQKLIVETSVELIEFFEKDITETKKVQEKAKKFFDDLSEVDTDNEEEFLAVVGKHKDFVYSELKKETLLDAQFELMTKLQDKIKSTQSDQNKKKSLEKDKDDLEDELQALNESLENARRRKRGEIEDQIIAKERELDDISNEVNYLERNMENVDALAEKEAALQSLHEIEVDNEVDIDLSDISDSQAENEEKINRLDEQRESLARNKFKEDVAKTDDKSTSKETIAEKRTALEAKKSAYKNKEATEEELIAETKDYVDELKSEKEKLRQKVNSGTASTDEVEQLSQTEDEIEREEERLAVLAEKSKVKEKIKSDVVAQSQAKNRKLSPAEQKEAESAQKEKLEDRLSELESAPETAQRKAEKQAIAEVIEEMEESDTPLIASKELEEALASSEDVVDTDKELNISPGEKADILESVDKKYSDDITQLREDYEQDKATEEDLIDRKENQIEKIEKRLVKVEKEFNRKGVSEALIKEKKVLSDELDLISMEKDELIQLKQAKSQVEYVTEAEEKEFIEKHAPGFTIEIEELEQEVRKNPTKKDKLVQKKKEYLSVLDNSINTINSALENKYNEELEKEKSILEKERRSVKIEIEELEQSIAEPSVLLSEELKEELKLSNAQHQLLESTSSDVDELKRKERVIDNVIAQLENIETDDPIKREEKNASLRQLRDEKRKVSIEIGEVTKIQTWSLDEEVAESTSEKEKEQIEKGIKRVNELEDEYHALSEEKEKRKEEGKRTKRQERKLDRLEEKVAEESADVLAEKTTINKRALDNKAKDLDTSSVESLVAKKQMTISERLIKEAENSKDPILKKELLEEAKIKQDEAIASFREQEEKRKGKVLIGEISTSKNIDGIDPEQVISSADKTRKEQQQIGLKLIEVEEELKKLEVAKSKAKSRDKKTYEAQQDELIVLRSTLENRQKENTKKLKQIEAEEQAIGKKGIAEEAIDMPVTYQEEVEFAKSDEYEALHAIGNEIKQKQIALEGQSELLSRQKRALDQALSEIEDKSNSSVQEQEKIASLLKEITTSEEKIADLKREIESTSNELEASLPDDKRTRHLAENLIIRNVNPVEDAPRLPVRSTGLVLTGDKEPYTDDKPIPLEAKNPGGLVFRVQIGAFSRPVPNETFGEFSPISGEEVRPGLIRYMAGYFGERNHANRARDQIREMGYDDAFVVAYCDGERIPVYKALQLLESGECVPEISSPEMPIIADSDEIVDEEATFEAELDEFAYNKAPGAAEADVAEAKMGLYYTVQVGVYNKPASHEQLKFITPLITKRLPNGQMRYSSGIYNNVEEATVKRQEAISKGITDAFIVAYYKGERITVSQAKKLIKENGQEILELNSPTVRKRNKVLTSVDLPDDPKPEPYMHDKSASVQWISKETYSVYPAQVLHNYNQTGALFYYDQEEKIIKSFIYDPEILEKAEEYSEYFNSQLIYKGYVVQDTMATTVHEALVAGAVPKPALEVRVAFEDLNDDLFSYMLDLSNDKVITNTESGILFIIYPRQEDPEVELKSIIIRLVRLGATEIVERTINLNKRD